MKTMLWRTSFVFLNVYNDTSSLESYYVLIFIQNWLQQSFILSLWFVYTNKGLKSQIQIYPEFWYDTSFNDVEISFILWMNSYHGYTTWYIYIYIYIYAWCIEYSQMNIILIINQWKHIYYAHIIFHNKWYEFIS